MSKERSLLKKGKVFPKKIYEKHLRRSVTMRERTMKGRKVIRGKDISWEHGRHGIIKWYVTDEITDTALETMSLFVNEIRTHGGKHVHQGGVNIFVLRGKGYSIVDGARYDWQEGDLIMLPIRPGGVEHQHFNLGDTPSRWVALISRPISDVLGRSLKQREVHPDWRGKATQ